MKLKDWVAKEGRNLKWVSMKMNIPRPVLYSYTSGKRSLPEKYINPIIELTNGECSEEDLKQKREK